MRAVPCEFCHDACWAGTIHPCCAEARARGDIRCVACAESRAAAHKHEQRAATCMCEPHHELRAATCDCDRHREAREMGAVA